MSFIKPYISLFPNNFKNDEWKREPYIQQVSMFKWKKSQWYRHLDQEHSSSIAQYPFCEILKIVVIKVRNPCRVGHNVHFSKVSYTKLQSYMGNKIHTN